MISPIEEFLIHVLSVPLPKLDHLPSESLINFGGKINKSLLGFRERLMSILQEIYRGEREEF
jgi:hypothetical protein